MQSYKFQIDPSRTVAIAWSQTFLEVGSLDLAWWPDLRWPGVIIFRKVAERMCGEVWKNGGAAHHRFLTIFGKPQGGGCSNTPPPAGRGLIKYVFIPLKYRVSWGPWPDCSTLSSWACPPHLKIDPTPLSLMAFSLWYRNGVTILRAESFFCGALMTC